MSTTFSGKKRKEKRERERDIPAVLSPRCRVSGRIDLQGALAKLPAQLASPIFRPGSSPASHLAKQNPEDDQEASLGVFHRMKEAVKVAAMDIVAEETVAMAAAEVESVTRVDLLAASSTGEVRSVVEAAPE